MDDYYDPIENIKAWQSQQNEVHDAPDGEDTDGPGRQLDAPPEHGQIARLCAGLLDLFNEIARVLALVIWSDGYGIAQGRFDDAFTKSHKLRRITIKTLAHIGNALMERLIPGSEIWSDKLREICVRVRPAPEEAVLVVQNDVHSDTVTSSSGASTTHSGDNLVEIAEDLRTDTQCLAGLGPLLKHPIQDLTLESEPEPEPSVIDFIYADKIESRFPKADEDLVTHLGKANFERYLRCQAARDSHEKEVQTTTDQELLLLAEVAGTLVATSMFHDSGIGTSIAPTVSYAETMMSYRDQGRSVRIPPLPDSAKERVPFICVACGGKVLMENNSAWKRHIYADLQPYICLDLACPYSSVTFGDREKWVSHLALDHAMEPEWRSIRCFLCAEETGDGKLAVTRHMAGHLEEISLSALPAGVNSNENSDGDSETNGSDKSDGLHESAREGDTAKIEPPSGDREAPHAPANHPWTDKSRALFEVGRLFLDRPDLVNGFEAFMSHEYQTWPSGSADGPEVRAASTLDGPLESRIPKSGLRIRAILPYDVDGDNDSAQD
ncbi:hypothetical protein B0T22DRAFT_484333 [Podospora appendiculata]|uniref:Oxidoreductase acuF-like C2H2 type zinc-finger domain-containing protein n=1 Tax=Podospora appendiculata TaxID=314037 RepID=A0AAE0X0E1_9PEZI|nr:hypothetical protein B0T22DRAFT_484333 [Podospora appendiculata]